jgi:16S rRNA processing protein RimM
MDKDGYLHIGRIVGVHGIKGYLKLYSFAESADLFSTGSQIRLQRRCGCGQPEIMTIRDFQAHRNSCRIAFAGVDDRESAHVFIDADLFIERSALPEPEEGAWYRRDLIGLDVFGIDGAYIGRIENIFATGSNDVFVVENNGAETLVPAIKSVVLDVDPAAGRVTVDLPEGL